MGVVIYQPWLHQKTVFNTPETSTTNQPKGHTMFDSRKLDHLSIPMLACCVEFENQLRGYGLSFVRTCTYRDRECQDKLFAQGRTAPGLVVTWARGGQSPHNDTVDDAPASNAADYYPLLHGKLCDNKTDQELALWHKMGEIGEACGLEWGGRWQSRKKDFPHFQLPRSSRPR